jgi:hypothetical protein
VKPVPSKQRTKINAPWQNRQLPAVAPHQASRHQRPAVDRHEQDELEWQDLLPSARISAPVADYVSTPYALACADPLGASGGCDGDASHALCQER